MAGERPGSALRRSADILFTATVRAGLLRFRAAPRSSVVFTGGAADDSASGSARANLPDDVATGVTYHDIEIDYAIAAKLADPS